MATVKLTSEQKDIRFLVRVGLAGGVIGGLLLGAWIFFFGDQLNLGDEILIHGQGFHVNPDRCRYQKDKKDIGHPLTVVKARVVSDNVKNSVIGSAGVQAGSYEPKGGRFVTVRVLDGPYKDQLFYVPRGFITR